MVSSGRTGKELTYVRILLRWIDYFNRKIDILLMSLIRLLLQCQIYCRKKDLSIHNALCILYPDNNVHRTQHPLKVGHHIMPLTSLPHQISIHDPAYLFFITY